MHFRILHVAIDVWPTTDGDDCQGERYTSGPSDSDKEDCRNGMSNLLVIVLEDVQSFPFY